MPLGVYRGAWETPFPLLVFKNALLTALRTIFQPKMQKIAEFCKYNIIIFRGVTPLDQWSRLHREQGAHATPTFTNDWARGHRE